MVLKFRVRRWVFELEPLLASRRFSFFWLQSEATVLGFCSQSGPHNRESHTRGIMSASAAISGEEMIGITPQGFYEVHTSQASEIVLGLVGPLGTDSEKIYRVIESRLRTYGYQSHQIRISRDVIPAMAAPLSVPDGPKYERAKALINLGNQIRKESNNNAVLALAAAAQISRLRPNPTGPVQRHAYVVNSLKHPEEVAELRKVYAGGFYLFAVHTDQIRRRRFLSKDGEGMGEENAEELISRDEHESEKLWPTHSRHFSSGGFLFN
jgi:hypothetical protein